MINIAILGFGLIGSGVASVFFENESVIEKKVGDKINIKYILDLRKIENHKLSERLVSDYSLIVNDPEISLIVETMGGSHPAFEYTKQALDKGINVITSNKEVVAKFGAELLAAAKKTGARYFFEASVGGGIPIIRPMYNCLAANKINTITAILNGTTNFILTKMEKEQLDFSTALATAQANGYAESNPSADIDGIDTCRKICILSSLAFGKQLAPEKVFTEGIRNVSLQDIKNAAKFGCKIKLIARSEAGDGGIVDTFVCPMLVPQSCPLYNIEDVFNGIMVNGNVIGDVMFYGRGAGQLPTASAVVADIMDALLKNTNNITWEISENDFTGDFSENSFKRYISVSYVCDKPLDILSELFNIENIGTDSGNEMYFTTSAYNEKEFAAKLCVLSEIGMTLISTLRIL